MTRLTVLNNRHERIIKLNRINMYVCTGTPERKINQYYNLLLEIKKQKYNEIAKNTNCETIKESILRMI